MEERIRLSAEETERLRDRLNIVSDGVSHGRQPEVTLTWWEKDGYRSAFVRIRKVDHAGRRLLTVKDRENVPEEIPFSEILSIQSAVIELLEEPDGFLDFTE